MKPKVEAVVNLSYTMTKVLDRLKKDNPISIQDLRAEINSLKSKVIQLKRIIEILELVNVNNNNDDNDIDLKIFEDSEFQVGKSSKEYLNIIEQIISRKYILKIKIIINKEFALETLALVDIGVDRNIIREGLIPTKYYKKTTQALSTANDQRLNINYQIQSV